MPPASPLPAADASKPASDPQPPALYPPPLCTPYHCPRQLPRPTRATSIDLLNAPPPPADVILAGDICYEKPLAARVMAWLGQAKAAGATVLIGDPGRSYFPREGLIKLAEYQVATTRELEDMEVKKTAVWTLPG